MKREVFGNVVIEGGRRRHSMMVENKLDPDLYIPALADFLFEIAATMEIDLRPPQPSGLQGQYCRFSEGIGCQKNNVFPGLEFKLTTGSDEDAGWYPAILGIMRRLILNKKTFGSDSGTTMLKTSINARDIDRPKAVTILGSLRKHEEAEVNYSIGRRQTAPAGKVVSDFIIEAAALTKRLYMARTQRRTDLANRKFESPLEGDRCFGRLNSTYKKTVLRFCRSCNYGKSK